MITAGERRHKVSVQSRGSGQDAAGGPSDPWVEIASPWVKLEPLSARERLAAQATMPEATHLITAAYTSIWANPTVAAQYRVVFRGRYFNLSPPRNTEERNIEVKILATEGLDNG